MNHRPARLPTVAIVAGAVAALLVVGPGCGEQTQPDDVGTDTTSASTSTTVLQGRPPDTGGESEAPIAGQEVPSGAAPGQDRDELDPPGGDIRPEGEDEGEPEF